MKATACVVSEAPIFYKLDSLLKLRLQLLRHVSRLGTPCRDEVDLTLVYPNPEQKSLDVHHACNPDGRGPNADGQTSSRKTCYGACMNSTDSRMCKQRSVAKQQRCKFSCVSVRKLSDQHSTACDDEGVARCGLRRLCAEQKEDMLLMSWSHERERPRDIMKDARMAPSKDMR